jgi:uroporphyrinogen decarboxylase
MARELEQRLGQQGVSWPALRDATEDVLWVGPDYVGAELPPDTDLWGIRRASVAYGGGSYDEIVHYPLAGVETVDEIEAYAWPSTDVYDYESLRRNIVTANPDSRRATRLAGGNPFEIYCWMTGLEESLTNILIAPEVVEAALGRISDFFDERLRYCFKSAASLIDMVFLADDLGGQSGLLLARPQYCALIQPSHKRLTATIRESAPHATVEFHTDGAVFDILPDLIDAGVQVLEAVQTDAAGMDPVALKATYGDRLGFQGGISVQQLLPNGTADSVADECRRLVSVFGSGGGYIAAPSHAIQYGTPVENILAMLRGVLGDEDYEAALALARAAYEGTCGSDCTRH